MAWVAVDPVWDAEIIENSVVTGYSITVINPEPSVCGIRAGGEFVKIGVDQIDDLVDTLLLFKQGYVK